MYKMFSIPIAILLNILVEVLAENKTETIEALEKEKGKLFEDINTAIDESVRSLKNANDSDAALGVTYMQQLKEQLNKINGTDFKDAEAANDTRRSRNFKLSLLEVAKVFQEKKSKAQIEIDKNKVLIQKNIDEWMLQREKEKKKIKNYREKKKMNRILENCPRYGVGKKKPISLRRKASDKDTKVKKTLPKYPCCRKCCKKSYLGCL